MVFNGSVIITVLLVTLFIWVGVVTALLVRMINHYNRLVGDTSKAGLREVLDELLKRQGELQKDQRVTREVLSSLIEDGKLHLSRIGVVRFNPFADTGGAQSFTLALLDGKDNGLVMTSLYGRSGNRWYVKEVIGGKGKQFDLSKEELEAVKQAKTIDSKKHE